jgi:perosamine synthetase
VSETGRLAIDGGEPVRRTLLPYGRQSIEEGDVEAVAAALRSDWLTTGPRVQEFERAFAARVGAKEAVAVSSGTAALHAAMRALGVGPGDEVIVPTLTFAATANAVLYEGARPVFADVDPDTLLLTAATAEACVTPRTRAIVGVDYAGQPCPWSELRALAARRGLHLVADACHSLGAVDGERPSGTCADLSCFSLHPVKHVTSGEGGVVTTDQAAWAAHMRRFRNHGISADHAQRAARDTWVYDVVELGFNYRLTDFQCALAMSQLQKLDQWVARRNEIAARYDGALTAPDSAFRPLGRRSGVRHAHHLYVVRLRRNRLRADRAQVFAALRAEGIGVNVHYRPVHLNPYYREHLGTAEGLCPAAERAYEEILSLPLFPRMSDADVDDVLRALLKVAAAYAP